MAMVTMATAIIGTTVTTTIIIIGDITLRGTAMDITAAVMPSLIMDMDIAPLIMADTAIIHAIQGITRDTIPVIIGIDITITIATAVLGER